MLLINKALVFAYQPKGDFLPVVMSTTGIIFLGTPHRGSQLAPLGTTIANCASVLGFDTNTTLLKTLIPDDKRSIALLSSFTSTAAKLRMKLWCFYETQSSSISRGALGKVSTIVS